MQKFYLFAICTVFVYNPLLLLRHIFTIIYSSTEQHIDN